MSDAEKVSAPNVLLPQWVPAPLEPLFHMAGKEDVWFEAEERAEISQRLIDGFAVMFNDPQAIHTNPEEARKRGFPSTIAQGRLTINADTLTMGLYKLFRESELTLIRVSDAFDYTAAVFSGTFVSVKYRIESYRIKRGTIKFTLLWQIAREDGTVAVNCKSIFLCAEKRVT